jgi:dienelactone hydrolase
VRTEYLGPAYLALPEGPGPHPGVVVVHEASGLNDNIREVCRRFAGEDFITKAAGVLETELTAAGIPHDLKVYPRAKHSFFNDQWRNYHPSAATDSWQRVLAFFAEHVSHQP